MLTITEEMIDIVNDDDHIIGSVNRSCMPHKFAHYRVVNGFLINKQGMLWIPLRSASKKIFPSALDFSFGGFVSSGESYEDAFGRELQEELCMNKNNYKCEEVAYFSPLIHNVSSFMKVYTISTEETPLFNKNDFTYGNWISKSDLCSHLKNKLPHKSDLYTVIMLLTI